MSAPTLLQRTISDSAKTVTRLITIPTGGDAEATDVNIGDVSTFTGGGVTATSLSILSVRWALDGFSAVIEFDASTDVHCLSLVGTGSLDAKDLAGIGITNNAGTGVTGDVFLTTSGVSSTDHGFILITYGKVV